MKLKELLEIAAGIEDELGEFHLVLNVNGNEYNLESTTINSFDKKIRFVAENFDDS